MQLPGGAGFALAFNEKEHQALSEKGYVPKFAGAVKKTAKAKTEDAE